MEDNLIVTDKTKIVIYGAGEVGNICYKRLQESGYCVVAAIDKNQCGRQAINGIFTYKIEEFPKAFKQMNELVVVICLADGLAHRDVADILYQMGFQYIIFLPLDYCINDSEKIQLMRIYNKVLEGINDHAKVIIKNYSNFYLKDIGVSNSILLTTKGHYTVWLGMELLFTESLELWEGDKTKIHGKDEFKDKSIANDDPNEMLFHFFDLRTGDYERYFSSYKGEKTDEQKRSELEKREKLYRLFKQEHNKGMSFFIESAPHVVWNPRNYFNLVGGHHRTMYLLSEGHTVFPVVVSKRDFIKWCNTAVYKDFVAYIKCHHIERLYAPLPHPGMLNFPVKCEAFGETKLKVIMHFMAHLKINDMRILDCSGGQAYYARNMERIGVKEAIYIDDSRENIELTMLMNDLLYRNNVDAKCIRIEELPFDVIYDVVFALDKFEGQIFDSECMILKILERITKKYLFWEFSIDSEQEYILKNSSFSDFRLLHREYRAGKYWNMGVFYKD